MSGLQRHPIATGTAASTIDARCKAIGRDKSQLRDSNEVRCAENEYFD